MSHETNSSVDVDVESVLLKIKKLFALAGNNPSEQEATAAMAKAQELLAKHNLSMAQLDATKDPTKPTTDDTPRTKTKVERSAMFQYQRTLWQALADANFCFYWSQKQFHASGIYSTHHHFLIGREDNVEIVKVMGVYLEGVVNRLCPYKVGKEVNLWKTGCIDRISERLQSKKTEMETRSEATSTTALVLADVYDREMHANHLYQNGNSDWCQCKKCREKRHEEYEARWRKEQEERDKELPTVQKEEETQTVAKTETEAQKRKREAREARDRAKWNERWNRERRKQQEKYGSEAYQSGVKAGDDVSLNSQIKEK